MGSAVGLWSNGWRRGGLELADLLVEFFPKDAGAWHSVAQLRADSGLRDEAMRAYRTCLEHVEADPALDANDRQWLAADVASALRGLQGAPNEVSPGG